MSIRNRTANGDEENQQTIMTPEQVASMPMQDIKKALLQLGLDPDEPLPERLKRLIGENQHEVTVLEPIAEEENEREMVEVMAG
jgi:hypothetical protein